MAATSENTAQSMQNSPQWATLSQTSQPIIIELGRTEVPISFVLQWSEGSLIELDKVSGEAVDIYIKGQLFARGEVVTIAENFGVRIVEILTE